MDESALHLMAYEGYFDGIEEKLRQLIHLAQRLLYDVDSDSWQELREFLAQGDDVLLRLIQVLPDYDALAIDEDAFHKEEVVLLSDGARVSAGDYCFARTRARELCRSDISGVKRARDLNDS
jgi:hypothetical protein